MTSPIADGVMAATYKLVQQAMTGQWQDVPKTVEERRVLLEQLSASATSQDQQWLAALKQAMAESDAAVAKMAVAPTQASVVTEQQTARPIQPEGTPNVDSMLEMIRGTK